MMAAARGIDVFLPTTATRAVALAALGCVQPGERSFGGFRLCPTPSTSLDEDSSRAWGILISCDSPPARGESEPSPGEPFHAPGSPSWEPSAVMSPGTPKNDV